MSTAGKYGERQSWRKTTGSEADKRKATKSILTVLALLLLALFLFILLRPRPNRELVTIVVSPSYNLDVVTPCLFAESARQAFRDQLAADVVNDSKATILARLQETTQIAKYFDDSDDTLLVVIRGYLLENAEGEPALACTDLNLAPGASEPTGLLPLREILTPLVNQGPESFSGTRLVVLDVEPLAAHSALGQANESVFASLESLVQEMTGPFVSNLWVLSTRAPLQNVSWDPQAKLPLSTKTFLDGLSGQAELDGDGVIELSELCAFISDRYARLPRNADDAPRIVLYRGGQGTVSPQNLAAGELDVWVNRYHPTDQDSDIQNSDTQEERSDAKSESRGGEEQPTAARDQLDVRSVVFQSPPSNGQSEPAEDGRPTETPTNPSQADASSPVADPNQATENASGQSNDAPPSPTAVLEPIQRDADKTSAAPDFWTLRDRFQSVSTESMGEASTLSPLALSPHLWRQLTLKVLAAEIQRFDPVVTDRTSLQIPEIVTGDLAKLQRLTQDGSVSDPINDDIVGQLADLMVNELARSNNQRQDRRLTTANALQHCVAAAYCRLWSFYEFERQAILANATVPINQLLTAARNAERTLASALGGQAPTLAVLERQQRDLIDSINAFDRNVDQTIEDLANEFSRRDPERTWELVRIAYAWLRSPLPSADQRRRLRSAIVEAPIDSTDVEVRDIQLINTAFGKSQASESDQQRVAQYNVHVQDFYSPPSASVDASSAEQWHRQFISNPDQTSFAPRLASMLRVDPRYDVAAITAPPLRHAVTAAPIIRRPSVVLVDSSGTPLVAETEDSTVVIKSAVRLESSNDSSSLTLRIKPDRPSSTRLLISYRMRTSTSDFRDPPVSIELAIPGQNDLGPDQTTGVTIAAEQVYELPIRITAGGVAEPNEQLHLELTIRGDRTSDQIDGVVGTYQIPVELPAENRLVVVASNYRGIGCSRPTESGEGSLPGGMWLRTFNDRKTPFQLSLYNQADKACRAKVWLIRLPNPMPQNVRAYWPDFAARRYSDPVDGRILDNDGRLEERYLRPERVILGPGVIDIPAGNEHVPLRFVGDKTAEETAPISSPPEDLDISHGMALVCRLIDQDGNTLADKDQVIFLVARPWSPRDYIDTKVTFNDGRVEVNASLRATLDGDQERDEIPEIQTRPVVVTWQADDQWANFQSGNRERPDFRPLRLRGQSGEPIGFISVPINERNSRSWVRLDVDGWPRAISHLVEHQSGSVGQSKTRNQVEIGSVIHVKRPSGEKTPPAESIFAPRREVYFKGGGELLRTVIRADFSDGDFVPSRQPEIRLSVEGRPYATYHTDRIVKTQLSQATLDGVVTLKTTVSDLSEDLPQGQYTDERVPITATLLLDGREEESTAITAVMDSTLPNSITVRPTSEGPYIQGATVGFTIAAIDGGAAASGIQTIEYGLDTTGDGQANTQRDRYTFDPPVAGSVAVVPSTRTNFKFPLAQNYHIAVRATDASGNAFESQYPIQFVKRPETSMAGSQGSNKSSTPAKKGWLHGKIDTRAGLNGTLTLSPAPDPVNMKSKDIVGQDRSFNFGLLPEGKYTLKFKGSVSNKAKTLTWEDLEIDTSRGKTQPLSLKLSDAK
ncbi:RodZ family helix-turn-helix domain-containing protein [Roseiconus lacunae]|uniref:hypothetical protein n=1 Tax=Roseiconus lacunae TaxID=2605694 RepID=UPI001E448D08|nr:hypothetical protein [Roseiconus lacunae]MCD0461332.1 hypothetical protein [Roseiconus lacunae]